MIYKYEHQSLLAYEKKVFDYFNEWLIISEQDRDSISHPNNNQIKIIPNGIDTEVYHPKDVEKKYDLLFVGNMQYPPNIVRQVFLSAVIFFVFLFGSQWLLNQDFSQSYQFLIALAPAVPAAWLAISIASAITQLDELQRRIQLEAIGIGFGGSVIITLTYALLVEVGIPQISWMFVPLLMVLLWAVGKLWTMWEYR